MKKLIVFLFCFIGLAQYAVAADLHPGATVDYIKNMAARRNCIITNTAPMTQGANIQYLLKTIDLCNTTRSTITNYGDGALATKQWANTNAVNLAVRDLVIDLPYIQNGLILRLDTVENAGGRTTWLDRSGNGNDFKLFNLPVFANKEVTFNGTNQYAKSIATLNLSIYSNVTVEIRFRQRAAGKFYGLYEHSDNFNTNIGGFGTFANTAGNIYNENITLVNHNINPAMKGANNYQTIMNDFSNHTLTNTFSSVPNPTGRLFYYDAVMIAPSGGHTNGTALNVAMLNDYMYIASRGGIGMWGNISIQSFRIYNRQLTAGEICKNAWTDYWNYGGAQPVCAQP